MREIEKIKLPVKVHSTGSQYGIKDATGRFLFRKTVNMLSHEQFNQLDSDAKQIAAALTDDGWKQRCEELEVAAAAMYLGHDDGRELFEMYKSVYLGEPAKWRGV